MTVAAGALAILAAVSDTPWSEALRFAGMTCAALACGGLADASLARLQIWVLGRIEARRRAVCPERFLLDVREIGGGVQRRVLTSLGKEALRARRDRRMNTVFLSIWPPAEPGMHVWEGRVVGDDWLGTWRRPTRDEVARHAAGEPVWRDE
jgi:hypothetical protein